MRSRTAERVLKAYRCHRCHHTCQFRFPPLHGPGNHDKTSAHLNGEGRGAKLPILSARERAQSSFFSGQHSRRSSSGNLLIVVSFRKRGTAFPAVPPRGVNAALYDDGCERLPKSLTSRFRPRVPPRRRSVNAIPPLQRQEYMRAQSRLLATSCAGGIVTRKGGALGGGSSTGAPGPDPPRGHSEEEKRPVN